MITENKIFLFPVKTDFQSQQRLNLRLHKVSKISRFIITFRSSLNMCFLRNDERIFNFLVFFKCYVNSEMRKGRPQVVKVRITGDNAYFSSVEEAEHLETNCMKVSSYVSTHNHAELYRDSTEVKKGRN